MASAFEYLILDLIWLGGRFYMETRLGSFSNVRNWHVAYAFDVASIYVRNFKFPTDQIRYLYPLLIQHVRISPNCK